MHLVQIPAEQVHPTVHAQCVGFATRVTCLPGEAPGQVEQGDGLRVVGSIAVDRTQVGRGLGHHGRRSGGQVQRFSQPQLGPVVAAAQEVHITEFRAGLRRADRVVILECQAIGLVQMRQTFLVEAAKRVDQRLGQYLLARERRDVVRPASASRTALRRAATPGSMAPAAIVAEPDR